MRDAGYTTGVIYIQSETPKVTKILRSRYFVVMDEITKPQPSPRTAVCITSSGTKSRCRFGCTSGLTIPKYTTKPTYTIICIR